MLGPAGLKHPARFGVYELDTLTDFEPDGPVLGNPAYHRSASGQYLFYKKVYDRWNYKHKIHRYNTSLFAIG